MRSNKLVFIFLFFIFPAVLPAQNYDELKAGAYQLPALFKNGAEKCISGLSQWQHVRRPEILKLFEDNVYGQLPKDYDSIRFAILQQNNEAVNSLAVYKNVAITVFCKGGALTISLHQFNPKNNNKPVPVFLIINHRGKKADITKSDSIPFIPVKTIINAGYAVAAFDVADVAMDDKERYDEQLLKKLYPEQLNKANGMGALGAWAWAASRCIDWFQNDPHIDARSVAVTGHSRGGKAALWCGAQSFIGSLKEMMEQRISFSLYMAHGGTSFGQWSGANAPPYTPTVSSYDYDAPITESGLPTEKLFAIRDLLRNYLNEGEQLADIPPTPATTIIIPEIKLQRAAPLFENLPEPKKSTDIASMEFFDQGWGRILYSAKIEPVKSLTKLVITDVHDWAAVYIDKRLIGTIDRRSNQRSVTLPLNSKNTQLDILVEATGRVNYGQAIIDRKGITNKVELETVSGKKEIKDWTIYNFPVDYAFQKNKKYKSTEPHGAAWYTATFHLNETGDTFLDMRKWGKGMVWINGHNMGRFWNIGPTQTMYIPGVWLKKGINEIIVFDMQKPEATTVKGLDTPILSELKQDESLLHRKAGQQLDLTGIKPLIEGSLPKESGWQAIEFDKAYEGRYLAIEALNAQDIKDNITSLAEIEISDEEGKPLSTLRWEVLYADSEDLLSGSTADKIFDAQETVIWQTKLYDKDAIHPHVVLIDLGEVVKIKRIKLLPRRDNKETGMIKDYIIYFQIDPFKFKEEQKG